MIVTAAQPTQTPSANAGGRLVSSDGRELPLRAVHLAAEAAGGIARVYLTQTFQNPYDEAIEVRYLLPLPSEGAVSGFAFVLGDTRVEGVVTGKQEARQRFERALSQGRTAALLEQERTSLFTQRVGNVPPGGEILCELTIDQPLRWLEEGAWEWRFPTVVGARYHGAPGRVEDADRLSVPVSASSAAGGAGTGLRATLSLAIGDALTGAVRSPSHALETRGQEITEVRLEGGQGVRLDRDVVIRWPIALPDVSSSVTACRPEQPATRGDTFALLTVAPPSGGGFAVRRDLTFLIDTSGSMGGRPLDQAAQVVSAMIETLGTRDRIELIEFGNSPKRWKKSPVDATPANKKAAIQWVKSLRASGCTEMHRAVLEALAPLRPDSQRQVVLVTDGYIGFESEIVATLLRELPDGARLHTVGVGSAINRTLTQGAARAGRGTELIIGLDEDPQSLVPRLLAKTTAPLVTDLRVTGSEVLEVAPRQIPDLYAESPALFAVRLGPAGGTVKVTGRTADGPFVRELEVPALAPGEGHEGVAALFGREKVEDLEMTLSAGGSVRELNSAIEATGIEFQIATRLTSWVAVSKQITVQPTPETPVVEQPHELPHGVSAEGLGLRKPAASVAPQKPKPSAPKKRQLFGRRRAAPAEQESFADKSEESKAERAEDRVLSEEDGRIQFRAAKPMDPASVPSVEVPSISEDMGLVDSDREAEIVEVGADEGLATEAFELMLEDEEEDAGSLKIGDLMGGARASQSETFELMDDEDEPWESVSPEPKPAAPSRPMPAAAMPDAWKQGLEPEPEADWRKADAEPAFGGTLGIDASILPADSEDYDLPSEPPLRHDLTRAGGYGAAPGQPPMTQTGVYSAGPASGARPYTVQSARKKGQRSRGRAYLLLALLAAILIALAAWLLGAFGSTPNTPSKSAPAKSAPAKSAPSKTAHDIGVGDK